MANKERVKQNDVDEEDELLVIDWIGLFELAVLCPAPATCAFDGDLDRILSGDEPVPSLQGTVLM